MERLSTNTKVLSKSRISSKVRKFIKGRYFENIPFFYSILSVNSTRIYVHSCFNSNKINSIAPHTYKQLQQIITLLMYPLLY